MVIAIPCSGCSRKFSQILPVENTYCLDCEINIADLEEEAHDRGVELGLTVRPQYNNRKISLALIGKQFEYVHAVSYVCFQKFEINSQEMEVDRDIKRKHYMDSFLLGYNRGFTRVLVVLQAHLRLITNLKMEFGKRKSTLYLLYHAKNAKFDKALWDYNLISRVKKFIH